MAVFFCNRKENQTPWNKAVISGERFLQFFLLRVGWKGCNFRYIYFFFFYPSFNKDSAHRVCFSGTNESWYPDGVNLWWLPVWFRLHMSEIVYSFSLWHLGGGSPLRLNISYFTVFIVICIVCKIFCIQTPGPTLTVFLVHMKIVRWIDPRFRRKSLWCNC